MQNGVVVHFLEPQADLPDPACSLLNSEFFLLFDVEEQTATLHVLHDDVEIAEIVEKAVEFDYVGVVQEHLDLELVDELVQHVLHFLLGYSFDCYQHFCRFVDCWEDLTERTFAFATAQLEIGDR